MTGAIDEEIAQQMGGIFIACVERDADALVNLLGTLGVTDGLENRNTLKLELRDLLERYYGVPLQQVDTAKVFEEIMSVIRRYRLRLPPDLAIMGRTLLVSEGVGRMLYPEFRIIETARPYARKLMLQRFDPTKQVRELSKAVAEAAALFKRLPSDLSEILSKIKKGDLAVRFEHRGLERLIGELDRSSNRLSFAVVIAALIIGSSLIFQTGVGPTLFGYPVVGLVGFLLASILGVWLLIGILRAGRL